MPAILTQILDEVHRHVGKRLPSETNQGSACLQPHEITTAKECLSSLSKLKYEMQTNKPLRILEDTDVDVKVTDAV